MNPTDTGSGRGAQSTVPAEIEKWSWGAFLLNWIWGLGNRVPLALLVFVPFFGIVMVVILGLKGNEWAWRNKYWDSVEHFKAVQKKWAIAGFILLAGTLVLAGVFVVGALTFLSRTLSHEMYPAVQAKLNANPKVVEALGTPIVVSGFPLGKFDANPTTGSADIYATATGPKGSGKVYVVGVKSMGEWTITAMHLKTDSGITLPDLEGEAEPEPAPGQ